VADQLLLQSLNMISVTKSARGYSMIEILVVVGLIGVIGAVSVPMIGRTIEGFRLGGSARSLSNAMAVAKIRAASSFSRVRLYADLTAGTHHVETLDRTTDPDHWTTEGGATALGTGVTYNYSPVTLPPPGSQAAIVDTPQCVDDLGVAIADTWCITFNSRGIPVDPTGAPNADGVLYVTDGTAVLAVTVAPTGMIRLWRTFPRETPTWVVQ
jgi:prepilin-type N-terminal cleavage/methylation domain-containing protein